MTVGGALRRTADGNMVNAPEYLVRYGLMGDFGRFRAAGPLACRRGDRAVVRSHRGLEIGRVLRAAAPLHAHFLPNTSVGQVLRLVGPEEEQASHCTQVRGRQLSEHAAVLAGELALPLEVIDAEVLLDGVTGILYHLQWDLCDPRPFVSTLSREHELQIVLTDLTRPVIEPAPQDSHDACGSCGSEGGCGSCGSGGCGSCGSADPRQLQAYFAELREQMERRTSLL